MQEPGGQRQKFYVRPSTSDRRYEEEDDDDFDYRLVSLGPRSAYDPESFSQEFPARIDHQDESRLSPQMSTARSTLENNDDRWQENTSERWADRDRQGKQVEFKSKKPHFSAAAS